MADSEKKKRRSKQEAPIVDVEPEAAPSPAEDSVVKSKPKSKKKVVEGTEEREVEPGKKHGEAEKGEEESKLAPAPEHAEPALSDDSAAKSKHKSKKSVSETASPVQKEEQKPEEIVAESKTESDAVTDKKSKKRSTSKGEVQDKPEKDQGASGASTEATGKRDAPKRRKSTVGKFFDRLMGKEGDKDKDKHKESDKDKEKASSKELKRTEEEKSSTSSASKSSTKSVAVVKEPEIVEEAESDVHKEAKVVEPETGDEEQVEPEVEDIPANSEEDEGAATKPPRSKKKDKKKDKKKKKAEEEDVNTEEAVEGEEYYGEEPAEEEVVHVSAPPPRMPPPSAPRKAPAGPVKQGPEVTSVFSMKPQIKVEVDEIEEAKEYAAEDAKREVDFEPFCTAKPHYTIGKELTETAYNRTWEAQNSQGEPSQVVIKFYSNEPPRFIPSARVLAHIDLLNTISRDNSHVLPLLDSFVGEEYQDPHDKTKKGKESASSSDDHAASDEIVEHTDEAPVKSRKSKKSKSGDAEANSEEESKPVAEEEAKNGKKSSKEKNKKEEKEEKEDQQASSATPSSKKKDKKKDKNPRDSNEEQAPVHPEPKAKAPPSEPLAASSEPKLKTCETDHFLVFEKLPDSIQWAQHLDTAYTEQKVASLISGVLKALEGLHAAGYMHRAVSPTNVVVSKDGEARLTGFDFACRIDAPSGNVLASEQFKAPEIAHAPSYNQSVDLWGVGALAYFLLTGKQLFRESNNARLKIAIRDAKVNYDDSDWSGISSEAQSFCKSLLVKDAAARPSLNEAMQSAWLQNGGSSFALTQAVSNLKA